MSFDCQSRAAARELAREGRAIILALESSCDDTAAALVADGRDVLFEAASSQVNIHRKYGGVVPEVASRHHVASIGPLVQEALAGAKLGFADIDAVAVTAGPGLVGSLLTGVSAAKGYAFALGKPLIGVHHIEGHIAANYLGEAGWQPPFLCLVVSGGHTCLVNVQAHGVYELLGETLDDAAGEAFDKVAKAMGLPYPGGPVIDEMADGRPVLHRFTRPKIKGSGLDFSFSGLKTATLHRLEQLKGEGEPDLRQLAADFQGAVVDWLVRRTLEAVELTGATRVALAGGVAANRGLRRAMAGALEGRGIALRLPEIRYCTDNAAMIGAAAYHRLMAGEVAGLSLNARPGMPLGAT